MTWRIEGLDEEKLAEVWSSGRDHGGNAVEAFVDQDGGWPLRCCLRDSKAGDELAIVAWNPFPWSGPYAEVGPVVIHASGCEDRHLGDRVPDQFRGRAQILRPYGHDRRIAYDLICHLGPDDDLDAAIAELLANPDVSFLQARNVMSGCYSFTAISTRPAG